MILISQLAAALLLAPLTQHHHHLQHFAHARADKEYEVKLILEHIEEETLKFRDEIERAYGERCNTETLSQCSKSNFNACSSVFPNQQCMKADELVIGECGGGGGNCNALWDKTTSAVRIPSAHLARGLDPEIIETACYTLLADDYMRTKYENDEIFWEAYKVHPSLTYFGAHNGLFRILPALGQVDCGNYDPRKRPWFVAASSGPKDVIIVLDVSGSMSNYGKMDLAKKAAITVVDTLTISDRVAVIVFSDSAYQVPVGVGGGTDSLIRATNENKKLLIESIRQLSGGGATNFYAGFQKAFDALERTIEQEYTTGCNVAILFMTDGLRTTGPETDEVLGLINNSTQRLATLYGRDTKIFTFSLGAQADHLVTKEIACSTNGMWTPVDDIYGDLVGAMASYYKLFTLGLGDDTEFTAWVEPYEFFSAKKMGTTNSAPVFDRSVDPPLFLGVVAIDINLDALEQVLGEDARSSTMLQRFILLSTARCPKIHLSECQLDALRYLSGGQEATCGRCNSTEYPGIIPAECSLKPDLPNNLWQNTDMEGVKYEDRTCCEIGSNVPSEMCPNEIDTSNEISIGIIVGSSIASLCVICCCGWVLYKKCYISSSKSDDALYQIHVTKTATHNRIRRLEKDVETAENNALSYQKKKMTKLALVHMRRRKAASEEIERCADILENLNAGELRLERAKSDVQLVKSYSQLKEALQDVRRSSGMDNEDVEELVSDVCEEMELANSDALTEAIYNSDAIDEDELYEELRMLELKCEKESPSPRKSEVNTDEQVDFPSSEEVVNASTESPADEKPQKSTAKLLSVAEPKSAPLSRS